MGSVGGFDDIQPRQWCVGLVVEDHHKSFLGVHVDEVLSRARERHVQFRAGLGLPVISDRQRLIGLGRPEDTLIPAALAYVHVPGMLAAGNRVPDRHVPQPKPFRR